MKVKINTELLDLENNPIKKEGTNFNVTFKDVVSISLANFKTKEDTKTTSLVKGELSIKLALSKEEIELTSEEQVIIKDCVHGMGYSNLIYFRIVEILENK